MADLQAEILAELRVQTGFLRVLFERSTVEPTAAPADALIRALVAVFGDEVVFYAGDVIRRAAEPRNAVLRVALIGMGYDDLAEAGAGRRLGKFLSGLAVTGAGTEGWNPRIVGDGREGKRYQLVRVSRVSEAQTRSPDNVLELDDAPEKSFRWPSVNPTPAR
mgnify:CR=1 FL=1